MRTSNYHRYSDCIMLGGDGLSYGCTAPMVPPHIYLAQNSGFANKCFAPPSTMISAGDLFKKLTPLADPLTTTW